MKIKSATTGTTAYRFECLDRASIKDCFDRHGVAGLRDLVDALRGDVELIERLADAIEGGEAYDFGRDRICTWWGWG